MIDWNKIFGNTAVAFFSALVAVNVATILVGGVLTDAFLSAVLNAGLVACLAGALEWKREADGTPPCAPANPLQAATKTALVL